MIYRIPEVRALYRGVRRPTVMKLVVGMALLVPAVGTGLVGGREAEGSALAPRVTAAKAGEGAIGQVWRERSDARARADSAAELAREFGVSPDLAADIHAAALEAGIEPRVAFGLVRTESSFRRTAVSHVGAVGYTQLLPSTARWLAPGTSRSELFDRETNLRIGFRYLRYLLDRYDDNLHLALTAYNRGPGTVDRLVKRGRNPDNGYARKVLARRS
jgi:soluble lytic murein transglycosylase-like protein